MALYRRDQVGALLNHYGWLPRAGVQRTIAAHLGVSEATISRDVRAILTLPTLQRPGRCISLNLAGLGRSAPVASQPAPRG